MTEAECLNCGHALTDPFCCKCGQRASTHRFSIKHIFAHDFFHAIFHLDHGFLYTLKRLFVGPGHMAREFVMGKRVKYFNYFTLMILLISISHIIGEFSTLTYSDIISSGESADMVNKVQEFAQKYPRLYAFSIIPFVSFFSWFWFRRVKLNYAEHLVMNTYKTCGELIIGSTLIVASIITQNIPVLIGVYTVMAIALLIYSGVFLYQFFSVYNYSRKKLIFLSVMATFSMPLMSMVVTIITLVVMKFT